MYRLAVENFNFTRKTETYSFFQAEVIKTEVHWSAKRAVLTKDKLGTIFFHADKASCKDAQNTLNVASAYRSKRVCTNWITAHLDLLSEYLGRTKGRTLAKDLAANSAGTEFSSSLLESVSSAFLMEFNNSTRSLTLALCSLSGKSFSRDLGTVDMILTGFHFDFLIFHMCSMLTYVEIKWGGIQCQAKSDKVYSSVNM